MMPMMKQSLLPAMDQVERKDFFSEVAQAQTSVLLLDYDGTLAPFSPDRQQAFPYRGVTALLREIMASGRTRVVIITGRNAYEIVFLLRTDPVPEIWGSHGLQRLRPDGRCEMPRISVDVAEELSEAGQWLASEKLQRQTEFKPGSVAVHWRGLDDRSALELRDKVLRAWFPIAEHGRLTVLEFDGGVELRMPDRDKGDAVRTILSEMPNNAPVAYLGDDATDEHAFRALDSRGLTILVRPEWRKTRAQLWLKPPDDVLDFLRQWCHACCETESGNKIFPR
jgi:trehalose 6-phosphate phosphatase